MSSDPIVVGTDGSASAERAVTRAGEIARALGAAVHVVNSYGEDGNAAWLAAAGGVAVPSLHSDDQARRHAEQVVARATGSLSTLGVESRAHVCTGDPAQALITIAEGERAQMIVVGNRGMIGARRVLGSVPNRVSHLSLIHI